MARFCDGRFSSIDELCEDLAYVMVEALELADRRGNQCAGVVVEYNPVRQFAVRAGDTLREDNAWVEVVRFSDPADILGAGWDRGKGNRILRGAFRMSRLRGGAFRWAAECGRVILNDVITSANRIAHDTVRAILQEGSVTFGELLRRLPGVEVYPEWVPGIYGSTETSEKCWYFLVVGAGVVEVSVATVWPRVCSIEGLVYLED